MLSARLNPLIDFHESHLTMTPTKSMQLFGIVDEKRADTQTSVLQGGPRSAMCVQELDDSRSSAIHITYRSSLRSSSLRDPRHPFVKGCFLLYYFDH